VLSLAVVNLELGEAAEDSAGREKGLDCDIRELKHPELAAGRHTRQHVRPINAQPLHPARVTASGKVSGIEIEFGIRRKSKGRELGRAEAQDLRQVDEPVTDLLTVVGMLDLEAVKPGPADLYHAGETAEQTFDNGIATVS
jgi:hypothetical protein